MDDRQIHERNFKTAIIIAALNFLSSFIDINNFRASNINLNNHQVLISTLIFPLISLIVVLVYCINIWKYFKNVKAKNAYISKFFTILSSLLVFPVTLIIIFIIFGQLEVIYIPPSSSSTFDIYVQFMTNTTLDFLNKNIPDFLRFRYFYLIVGKGFAIIFQSIATIIKEKYVANKDNERNHE